MVDADVIVITVASLGVTTIMFIANSVDFTEFFTLVMAVI